MRNAILKITNMKNKSYFNCGFCKYFKKLYYQKYGGYKFCGYGICLNGTRTDCFTAKEEICDDFCYFPPEYSDKDFKAYCALREINIKFNNIQRFYDKNNQNKILEKIVSHMERPE